MDNFCLSCGRLVTIDIAQLQLHDASIQLVAVPFAGDATARIEVLEKQKAALDNSNRELIHDKRQLEAQAARTQVPASLSQVISFGTTHAVVVSDRAFSTCWLLFPKLLAGAL